jgi:glutamate/tyrosine decarboxylase-like PLP-dependent enzyme
MSCIVHCLFPPAVKTRGAAGGPVLVAFTSSHAHYSYEKAAHLTGLGTDNLVAVATDAQGQMLPHALEEAVAAALKQGKVRHAYRRTM